MKVLAKCNYFFDDSMGSEWQLLTDGNDFFEFGTIIEINSFLGVPVNQCGSKTEVLNHIKSILKLCKNNIKEYKCYMENSNDNSWNILIDRQKQEIKMLKCFLKALHEY